MTEEHRVTYRDLVKQYVALLNAWLASPDAPDSNSALPALWPLAPCPFTAIGADGLLHMLVAPGQRASGLRELRDFTEGATRLIILDPYFFAPPASSAEAYASEIRKTARFGSVREVHIVNDERFVTKEVRSKVRAAARKAGVRLSVRTTNAIHDRVWIADGKRGVAVGTSLNGLGSRAAFILPLPAEDLTYIKEFLKQYQLGPRPAA